MNAKPHHNDYLGERARVNLRVSPETKDKLAAYAKAQRVTMNDAAASIIDLVLDAHGKGQPVKQAKQPARRR